MAKKRTQKRKKEPPKATAGSQKKYDFGGVKPIRIEERMVYSVQL